MSDVNEQAPPRADSHAAASGSTPQGRPRWQRMGDRVLVLILLATAVSQPFIWLFLDHPLGDSIKNLITYSQGMLVVLCLLAWWFLCAPCSRKTTFLVGLPVVGLLLVGGASIRSVEFTGDMAIRVTPRWAPTRDEILDQHRRAQTDADRSHDVKREVSEATPEQMPAFRGWNRDGAVIGPQLNQDWSSAPPVELWRQPVGGGYSSFAIVEPYAVTLEQRGDDEAVVCYDTQTGREIWVFRYPAHFQEAMGGPGPRSTPTIHEDAVFSFGAFGDLFCLDLLTGERRWHINVLQQFELPNATWAMAASPLVHQGNVIVNIGGMKGNGLVAYGITDGREVWYSEGLPEPAGLLTEFRTGAAAVDGRTGNTKPGYSSPALEMLGGQQQILILDGTALRGHDPETGRQLWHFPFKTDPNVSVAQPIVFDDGRIFISASYGVGAAMVRVSQEDNEWRAEELWKNLNMKCKFTSPVLHDGYIYGLDEGILVCLDPADGKRTWKKGRYGHGQILLTNGQILILAEGGEAVLVDANPRAFHEVTRMRVLPDGKTWNAPALVRGRLYVRNAREMAAFDLRAHDLLSADR